MILHDFELFDTALPPPPLQFIFEVGRGWEQMRHKEFNVA